jgi:hypothetical protein
MALSKTVHTPQGFEATNAYHKIENVCLVEKTNMQFALKAYKNNKENVAFLDVPYKCEYSLTGENPIKQAYEYLKTLPDFAGATDC